MVIHKPPIQGNDEKKIIEMLAVHKKDGGMTTETPEWSILGFRDC